MPKRFKALCLLVLPVAGLLLPHPVRAQGPDRDQAHPRVERITFRGADALRRGDLLEAIITEETRCRGLIFRPICAITDWRLIHQRRYLDRTNLRADELRLRIYYFQRGYRRARVSSEVLPRGRGVEVVFHIEEGEPLIVGDMEVRQTERVLSRRQIRRVNLPREGEPLDLLRLSAGIVQLDDRLGRRGYLDGEVHDSVDITPDTLRARLVVVVEPGRRSTLGELDIDGNEDVTDRVIADALRLGRGRVLRSTDIAASQRSLYEANLFHEARVVVPEQPDSAKRVEITVREAPARAARVGGGFNTMEFIQAEARYTHYNWLGGGRRLDVRGTIGNLLADQLNGSGIFRDVLPDGPGERDGNAFLKPTWLASVEFMQPAFRSAANVVGLSAFTHRRIIPGVVIDEGIGAEASATRRFDFQTPVSATYRYELVAVQAGDLYFCVIYAICELQTIDALQERHRLSPAGLTVFSDRADDPIAPTTGYRLRVEAEHASAATMSDFRYNRVSASAAGYHPLDLHRRRVLAGRLRAGWAGALGGTAEAVGIGGEWDELLHPRKRFYSGGSRSVRGYRENQLGPRVLTVNPNALVEDGGCTGATIADGTCNPNDVPVGEFIPRPAGGRSVLEASIEYRFPVRGSVQGAIFLDGATVGDAPGMLFADGSGAITPGFGVRFGSPVGPIRIDVGIRPGGAEDLPVITEVLAPNGDRRLVRLDTPRRYDPVGDAGGFFSQALRRLTLHLSIGEAY
jgi:outer membrane protein insertion porin family